MCSMGTGKGLLMCTKGIHGYTSEDLCAYVFQLDRGNVRLTWLAACMLKCCCVGFCNSNICIQIEQTIQFTFVCKQSHSVIQSVLASATDVVQNSELTYEMVS